VSKNQPSFKCIYQYKGPDLGSFNELTNRYTPTPIVLCSKLKHKWQGEEINVIPLRCVFLGNEDECNRSK